LPDRPEGLAVGVELPSLGLEAAIGSLPAEETSDGPGGGVPEAGLLEFHQLVGAVADEEGVVEALAAVEFAVVADQELAHVGSEERLGGLPRRDLDACRPGHQAPPVGHGSLEPDIRVLPLEDGRVFDGEEGNSNSGFGSLAGREFPGEGPFAHATATLARSREFRTSGLAAGVGGPEEGPDEEVLALGGPVECLAPVLGGR